MTDLDPLFEQMRAIPAPGALADLESRVFAGVGRQRDRAIARQGLMLASGIAVAIGVSSSLITASDAQARPLFGIPTAAPSHLLAK